MSSLDVYNRKINEFINKLYDISTANTTDEDKSRQYNLYISTKIAAMKLVIDLKKDDDEFHRARRNNEL
jgi:hypothetical protein